ncbi:hypothetical protein GS501_00025 [Saccharibacter sp. 17.LH.SD]|uniref:hypothetical protein n=1 Tax=Saccharibacter sp. 17.LH.SD TaxID=2689393 RepID=UPI00136FAB15|nr:hypothetical protein [Saccharibacter sp. 17.LH.SD]MXV43467.1 hypothetical protein [Saccharibacter sp. 17.LH.SD]
MHLFIGNPTHQTYIFTFRRPGDRADQPSRMTIRAGAQVAIRDLDPEDARDIIKQHQVFGLCRASEAHRSPHYRGLVYSEDKPVNFKELASGLEDNHEKLTKEGQANRKRSAEAIAGQTMAQAKRGKKENLTKSMEVKITAKDDSGKNLSAFSQETYEAAGG